MGSHRAPAAPWGCSGVFLLPNSSLSQWVHACDALDLPMLQREELDAFIDQLYKDIEKGEGPTRKAQPRDPVWKNIQNTQKPACAVHLAEIRMI